MKVKLIVIVPSLILALLILFIMATYGGTKITNRQGLPAFSALYLISVLNDGPELLDPQNTESVWQYYLLENLSCGLIRDSKTAPSGYEGCIAEHFFQPDPNTWIFKLREIKWSDGTQVSKSDIDSWMSKLRLENSRHIQFFKQVETVVFDENSRELRVHFRLPIANELLHELSLADASLIPKDYKTLGWGRTVGPYYVKSWSKSNNLLLLSANKYSPFFNSQMPQEVELKQLLDSNKRSELFKSIKIDLALVNAMGSPHVARTLVKNAPQIYECHPNLILYFNLNYKNKLAMNSVARQEFAELIKKIQINFKPPAEDFSTLRAETQMIPEGFNGRIAENTQKNELLKNVLIGHTLKIKFFSGFNENEYLLTLLRKTFADAQIKIEAEFSDDVSTQDEDNFASLIGFAGNQLDPSGSWSFLLFSPEAPLHPWLSEMSSKFQSPKSGVVGRDETFFQDLHREVLSKHYAVPFLVGSQRYLLSDRVDASGWNRFDSRIRFYELRMR